MLNDGDDKTEPAVRIEHREEQYIDTKIKLLMIATYDGSTEAVALVVRFAEITRDTVALAELAHDKDHHVRAAVAGNKYATVQTVYWLSCDPHLDVRYTVAEGTHTPIPILKMLTNDENPYVASRASMTMTRITQRPSIAFPAITKEIRKSKSANESF